MNIWYQIFSFQGQYQKSIKYISIICEKQKFIIGLHKIYYKLLLRIKNSTKHIEIIHYFDHNM